MTSDKDDGTMQQQVSETYREYSTERAPDSLNDKVLAMAAAEVNTTRRGYSFLAPWSRPLAVAATVVLSLAIVLKVADVPEAVMPAIDVPQTLEEEFRPKDNSTLEDARNQARLRAGPDQLDESALKQDAANEPVARQDPADIAPDSDSAVEVTPVPAAPQPLGQATSSPAARTAEPGPSEAQPEKASRDAATPSAFTSFSVSAEKLKLTEESYCDDAREDAEDWLACIDELRQAGDDEQADAEYERFLLEFPVE